MGTDRSSTLSSVPGPTLTLNLHQSSCLRLWSAGTKGMHHHAWILFTVFTLRYFQFTAGLLGCNPDEQRRTYAFAPFSMLPAGLARGTHCSLCPPSLFLGIHSLRTPFLYSSLSGPSVSNFPPPASAMDVKQLVASLSIFPSPSSYQAMGPLG